MSHGAAMIELSRAFVAGLPRNGETDPIEYYRRPLVGILFRERINRGLRLLPTRRFASALEVGYGAGAVLAALAEVSDELHGLDRDADPKVVEAQLKAWGHTVKLVQGSVYELPYADQSFDLVASFSMFEHLDRYEHALREVTRVLKPGGLFLLGMPAVSKLMEAAFLAIGFRGIDHHHITTPGQVAEKFEAVGLRLLASDTLDVPLRKPLGYSMYYDWLLTKPQERPVR